MGISTHYYTVYGIKHEWDDQFAEVLDEVYGDSDLPNVILDGMGGEYMILGEILFDSGDLRYGEFEDQFKEIDLKSLAKIEKKYIENFKKKFPKWHKLVARKYKFKLMTFAHYS